MSKIKILHIAPVLAGVETAVRLIAGNLDENIFELVLIKDLKGNVKPLTYKSGIPVPTYFIDFGRAIHPFNDSKFIRQALKITKNESPDLIHCHSAKCGIIGRTVGQLLSIPTFYTPHAFSYLSAETPFKKKVFLAIEKLFSHTNSHIVACSASEASRAVQDVGYNPAKVHIINNALPDYGFKPLVQDNKLLCTVGRPSFQKNTLHLVNVFNEALKIDPELRLEVLGVGYYSPDLQSVKEFIAQNNIEQKVKLVDWTSREETLNTLSKASLYLSSSRYEGLPFAVLEALSLGKPCILSNVDGHKDCVEDGHNGYLFVLDQPYSSIAQKVCKLLNDPQQLKTFGQHSRDIFKKSFFIEKNIKGLEHLYQRYKN